MRTMLLAAMLLASACEREQLEARDREIATLKARIAELEKRCAPPPAATATEDGAHEELPPGITPLEDKIIRNKMTEADFAALVAEATRNSKAIKYAQLKKNADRYKGTAWRAYGVIVEIHEKDGTTEGRFVVNGYDPNAILYFVHAGETEFLENSVVDIVGVLTGTNTYESQAGWTITIPSIMTAAIAKHGAIDKRASLKR